MVSGDFHIFDGLILVFNDIIWVVGMEKEPVALFQGVLAIDESPRVVGTRFVNATPASIFISKGYCDSTFRTHMEIHVSQRTPEAGHLGECVQSQS